MMAIRMGGKEGEKRLGLLRTEPLCRLAVGKYTEPA
jgi:hypothetical protein